MANGQKTPVSAFHAVVATATVSVTFLALLWTFQTESDRKYQTRFAHDDFVKGNDVFKSSVLNRLDQIMPRREFLSWKEERDKRFDKIEKDVEGASTRIEQAMRDRASIDSLNALQRQLDSMRDQIKEIYGRK